MVVNLDNLDDGLDLDGDVERQRVRADGRARVLLAEDVEDEIRGAVDDGRLAREPVDAIDKADELVDLLDLVQVPELALTSRRRRHAAHATRRVGP